MARAKICITKRFWSKVDVSGPDECWEWQAGYYSTGYGQFDNQHAHRVAWTLENGPIPEGMCVLHKCDNRPCVNPAHLFLGTQQDNLDDMVRKGRQVKGEQINTAKLTEDDVIEIRIRYKGRWGEQTELAIEFGVSVANIGDIVHGKIWKHLLKDEEACDGKTLAS